ncbi:hypothetical protein [Polaribacter cellanae]|uniref:Uncharacterized protein n=1 Tax=Polaribacter cellanae TaxID=2818493 RepID=A0A975CJN3_9FLAO|nr:hypothetical protein [Polaribacter cellanae]QTE21018.1 hypothetical protein J3359_09150 [Polaribacter cellanae]
MENLETKQILLQLEKQHEDFKTLKNDVRDIKNNKIGNDVVSVCKMTLLKIKSFEEKHDKLHEEVKSSITIYKAIHSYLEGIMSKFPLKTTQEIIFKGKIKWQLYLFTIFLTSVIIFSTIRYNSYVDSKNDTFHDKAFKSLLKKDLPDNFRKQLNSLLEEAKKDS